MPPILRRSSNAVNVFKRLRSSIALTLLLYATKALDDSSLCNIAALLYQSVRGPKFAHRRELSPIGRVVYSLQMRMLNFVEVLKEHC
jgi:hypothetical protein